MWHLKNEKNASHFGWSGFSCMLRKVACAAPHNAFYCRARNVERAGGAGPPAGGRARAHSLSGENLPRPPAEPEPGRRRMTRFLPFPWERERWGWTSVVSNLVRSGDNVESEGEEKCHQISDLGPFRKEVRCWNCFFFLRFGLYFSYTISRAFFGERG